MNGKEKCKLLKKIREMIAKKNGIPYQTEECTAKGDCKGYCPKCDEELRDLNKAIAEKEAKGKKKKIPKKLTKKLSADCVDVKEVDTLEKLLEERNRLFKEFEKLKSEMDKAYKEDNPYYDKLLFYYKNLQDRMKLLTRRIAEQTKYVTIDGMMPISPSDFPDNKGLSSTTGNPFASNPYANSNPFASSSSNEIYLKITKEIELQKSVLANLHMEYQKNLSYCEGFDPHLARLANNGDVEAKEKLRIEYEKKEVYRKRMDELSEKIKAQSEHLSLLEKRKRSIEKEMEYEELMEELGFVEERKKEKESEFMGDMILPDENEF